MSVQLNNLKSEKFTFIALIGIMLFSLIYISSYSVSMKDKMDTFRREIQATHQEMNLLLEFIPVKDSVIATQKQKILLQMEEIQHELARNAISEYDRKQLSKKLNHLKIQVEILKNQAKQSIPAVAAVEVPQEQVNVEVVKNEDLLLHTKDKEIARLKGLIEVLQNQKPDIIVQNKLAVYYLTAVSSDKKYRAARTNFLNIQFQLKGDIASMRNKYLYIEIRDPSHRIISTETDKIRIVNEFITGYKFEPIRHTFIKGKYSVRIYNKDSDFQSVTFINLI